jgi:hypothetical protein
MANAEHLAILKQGVEVWNRWRADSEVKHPDLSNSDLSKSDFSGADFTQSDLKEVDLRDAKLSFADFGGADLTDANFNNIECMGSAFDGTNLESASFAGGLFIGTVFGNIHPRRTHLSLYVNGPRLHGTDFTQAQMSLCVFQNTDLSHAKGLATVRHSLPSSIDVGTLYKSKGKIPEVFLRGAGLPDSLIVFHRSLVTRAVEFRSCFISYSTKDQDFADRLYSDLQNNGVRCWLATRDLKIGDPFRQRIDEAIRQHKKLMVVLSSSSISSPWVEDEVESGIERESREGGLVLFPIRVDSAVMDSDKAWVAKIRRTRQIGDFSNWKDHDSYQQAFQRLLRDLKAEVSQTQE